MYSKPPTATDLVAGRRLRLLDELDPRLTSREALDELPEPDES